MVLRRLLEANRLHLPLIIAACIGVYWVALGHNGFAQTEGHRVAPAWRMLESGDWLRLELFGAPYLRKPPGLPWAIAASSWLLGENEFAARAPSALAATLMAVLAWWFTNRWFGRPWGLCAGLAQALMPVMWAPGRSAEIEALNMLAAQAAAFCLVELLWGAAGLSPNRHQARVWTLLTGATVAAMVVVKGPAAAPCLLGIAVAACLGGRALRPGLTWGLVPALAIAACLSFLAISPVWRHTSDPGAVHEDFAKFMWDRRRLMVVAGLLPVTFATGLPASLGLLFAWGAGARSLDHGPYRGLAQRLAWGWLVAVVLYTAAGIGNSRYAWPTVVFLPPLVGAVCRGSFGPMAAGGFGERRVFWSRLALLGHAAAWPTLLLVGAAGAIVGQEVQRARNDGSAPGRALGLAVPDGASVWASALIESRPDVLLYAQQSARAAGRSIHPLWKPQILEGLLPPAGDCVLLMRTSDQEFEPRLYAEHLAAGRLEPLHEGRVYKYIFTLYRVVGAGPR